MESKVYDNLIVAGMAGDLQRTPTCAVNVSPNLSVKPKVEKEPEQKLTSQQVATMRAYAQKLRRSNPKLSPAQLQKKVAKHFKINLV